MLFRTLIILSITTLIFSCNSREGSEETKKIDSLHHQVDVLLKEFNEVDTASINSKYAALLEKTDYIQKYNVDTLPLKTAQHISQYYTLRKKIDLFKNFEQIQNELVLTKEQLENLKHDYVNNIIDEKQFKEYLTIETNNYLVLESQIYAMLNDWEDFQDKFPQYDPKIDSLVNTIRTKRKSLNIENS